MILGCIGDDFTGSSDLANTLTKEGMATIQFVGVPEGDAPAGCEAGVVALKSRSIDPGEAVRQSLAALDWLKRQGCRQFLFKYCSTFDSTPRGNIGPVAEALLGALDAPLAVVCPVFPATGRTLFLGHLFVNGKLLNESGMEHHPINPMTDANIGRWLQLQTKIPVGLVPYAVVREGPAAIRAALDAEAAAGRRLIVTDAVVDEDLHAIGAALRMDELVTGGSGIALGLPANFRREGLISGAVPDLPPVTGPGVVLSGSCSTASLAQVAAYSAHHPAMAVDPEALMKGALTAETARDWVMAHIAAQPIVYSTAEPKEVALAQAGYGREALAGAIENFFGALAAALVAAGVKRIVVGGGETSGAVVTALDLGHLRIGREIDPGVPTLAGPGEDPLGLALKSGNFGAVDFFEKALATLEAP